MASPEPHPAVDNSVQVWLRRGKATNNNGNEREIRPNKELSPDVGFVTVLHQACLERLTLLKEALKATQWSSRKSQRQLEEAETKFWLFGDSFEHGKLESCLGDEDIDEKILRFLFEIASSLTQDVAVSVLGKENIPNSTPDDTVESLEDLLSRARPVFEPSDTEEESTESEDSDAQTSGADARDAQAFYRRCLQPLSHYVGLLMELCPTLEAIYRFRHQTGERRPPDRPISVSTAARPYVSNVRDKFPHAAEELVNRLGEANWQRHERLRAIETTVAESVAAEAPKSVFRPVSFFKDSALGSSLREESERARSTASHSSFLSSNDGDKSRLRIPKLPAGLDWGQPFLCPFCHEMVDIRTRVAWKLHVYSDLQAYICTSKECPETLTVFKTRKGWAQHEIDHHLSNCGYRCPSCEDMVHSEDELLHHAKDSHDMATESLRSTIIAKARVVVRRPMTDVECQLCHRRSFANDRDYATHVGKHLEEIALIALPPTAPSDDEDSDEEDSSNEYGSKTSIELPARVRTNQQPPRAENGLFVCTEAECEQHPPTFQRESEWNRHMDRHERPYKCPDPACKDQLGFTYSGGLLRHAREVHGKNGFLFCPFSDCNRHVGQGFTVKENLNEHLRRRHNEGSSSRKDLDDIIRMRREAEPLLEPLGLPPASLERSSPETPSQKKHKCPYCSTEFTRHHNLKSHLLTHTQEKPFVCHTCNQRFRRLHDLKRHTKLHSGERPHVCEKCGRKFARGEALRRHQKGAGGCGGRRSSVDDSDSEGGASTLVHPETPRWSIDYGE